MLESNNSLQMQIIVVALCLKEPTANSVVRKEPKKRIYRLTLRYSVRFPISLDCALHSGHYERQAA